MRRQIGSHRLSIESTGKSGSIYVYDVIGSSMWADGISPKDIVEALEQLKSEGAQSLDVYLNSPGGSAYDGFAIYSAIRRFSGVKRAHVDGIAASAASVVAMACDRIGMSSVAQFMIHNAAGVCIGEARDMRKEAEQLDKIGESAITAYARKTGLTPEKLKALCDEETWLTASDAKTLGFCDEVYEAEPDEDEEEIPEESSRAAMALFARYKRAPPEAAALMRRMFAVRKGGAHQQEEAMSEAEKKALEEKLSTMSGLLDVSEKEKAEAAAGSAELFAALGVDSHPKALAALAGLKACRDEGARAVEELTKVRGEQLAAKRLALIDDAAKSGRLTPAKREQLLSEQTPAWSKDLEALNDFLEMLPVAVPSKPSEPAPVVLVTVTPEDEQVAKMTNVPAKTIAARRAEARKQ